MPLYPMRCLDCDYGFEFGHSIHGEPPVVNCPYCGGVDVRRVWTVPGVAFKGTGWGKDRK